MPENEKRKREPTFQDREEAKRVILGKSAVYAFDEITGELLMPNGKEIVPKYSKQHRGIEIAVIDLLLQSDAKGLEFFVHADSLNIPAVYDGFPQYLRKHSGIWTAEKIIIDTDPRSLDKAKKQYNLGRL